MSVPTFTSTQLQRWQGWRHHLHQHPELSYQEHQTQAFIRQHVESWGLTCRSYGGTGLAVALNGQSDQGKRIGIRADIDGLPITEANDVAHQSIHGGKMHACGHDGHTVMALAALEVLAQLEPSQRPFHGEVVFIFQPAEEQGAGAKRMIDDGLLDDYPLDAIFAFHNWPGLALGHMALSPGPVMANTCEFAITFEGKGGHAAMPHLAADPLVVGASFITQAQTLVSRYTNPLDACVLTFAQCFTDHPGKATNVIHHQVTLIGTIRALSDKVQQDTMDRFVQLAEHTALANGMGVINKVEKGYPVTNNATDMTQVVQRIIANHYDSDVCHWDYPPSMGGEDFAYFLQRVPGCYIRLGNGDSASLHHPQYDFNDHLIGIGAKLWLTLIEDFMTYPG